MSEFLPVAEAMCVCHQWIIVEVCLAFVSLKQNILKSFLCETISTLFNLYVNSSGFNLFLYFGVPLLAFISVVRYCTRGLCELSDHTANINLYCFNLSFVALK